MSLQIQEKVSTNSRKCMGCGVEDDAIFMFKGTFFDEAKDDYVEEVYCNECLANILTEEPEMISDLEAI